MWWLWWGYIACWATVIYMFTRPIDLRAQQIAELRRHRSTLTNTDNIVDAVSLFLKEQRKRGP